MGHDQRDVPITGTGTTAIPVIAAVLIVASVSLHASETDHDVHRCGFLGGARTEHITNEKHGMLLEVRPQLPEHADSPDGRFRVHYSRVGVDAVPPEDVNANGMPDYVEDAIESLLLAYRVFIDTLGYPPPPADGNAGGSNAIDVYLRDLSKAGQRGTGLYGTTIPETQISQQTPPRYTSWIEIDNDFSPADRNADGLPVYATTGTDGLRVTCAHELHHTIQIGIYGIASQQLMVYELTSTWMEMRVQPSIPDWITYASKFFAQPAEWPFSGASLSYGYVWGFFGTFLQSVNSTDVLKSTWVNIGSGALPFQALREACADASLPLTTLFCQSLESLYMTGSRSDGNTNIPHAQILPEILLQPDERAQPPLQMVTGELRAFEVRAMRFSVPAANGTGNVSSAIILTWADEDAFVRSNTDERIPFTVTLSAQPSATDVLLPGSTWGVQVRPPALCSWIQGSAIQKLQSPYPQPLRLSISNRVFLPVPDCFPGENVTVTLMSPSFVGLELHIATVVLDDDRVAAPIELDRTLTPGIYLVRVETNTSVAIHKLIVQR